MFYDRYERGMNEIGLAEFIKAKHDLDPEDDETLASIARALGLGWRKREVPPAEKEINEDILPPTSELEVPIPSSDPDVATRFTREILQPVGQARSEYQPIVDLSKVAALGSTNANLHMKRPRYRPLLRDTWFAGLMSAILATPTDSDDIDLAMLLKKLARGELLEELPFRQRPTLGRGISLFLDRSESMQPFWRDEKRLSMQLQRFLGRDMVKVRWVEAKIWSPDGPTLKNYSASADDLNERAALLIVSDFGMRGERTISEAFYLEPWLPLIDMARKKHCSIAALVPASDSLWPKAIKELIPRSFVWDRDTSVMQVRRLRQSIH